MFGDSKIQFTN